MIDVSPEIREAMQSPVKNVQSTIQVLGDEESLQYTSNDVLQSVKIETAGYYFKTTMKHATIKLIGTDFDLVDKKIAISMDVLVIDPEEGTEVYRSVNLGYMTCVSMETNLENETTTVEAYDDMYNLSQQAYIEGDIEFPITVGGLIEAVADKIGFNLATDVTTLKNYDYTITEDLYAKINGVTYRSIMDEIAGATCTLAIFNADGELELRNPVLESDETWTYDNLLKVKVEPKFGPVNTIVLARTPQEDNVMVQDSEIVNAPSNQNILGPLNPSERFQNGFEITNQDGGLRIYGTATETWADVSFRVQEVDIPAGTYTFSLGEALPFDITVRLTLADDTVQQLNLMRGNTSAPVTVTQAVKGFYINNWGFSAGDEFDVILKPQLELGTTKTDFVPYTPNGPIEIKIANNEILDDDRELLISPILDNFKGFICYPFTANTEGHGWHEVGDRINLVDNLGNTYTLSVTETSVTLDGGIKETITGHTPDETHTNYALAGGITKTVYNTEIKVDKQNQQIESIVSEQESLAEEVAKNYTQITQNITQVVTEVQASGGANLLKNSVGFALDDKKLPERWITKRATGKNLFDKSMRSMGYYNSYGTLDTNSSVSAYFEKIPFKKNDSFTISGATNAELVLFNYFGDFERKIAISGTQTVNMTTYGYFVLQFATAPEQAELDAIQIEAGTSATEYESFNAGTITSQTSTTSTLYGGVSGNSILLKNATIMQAFRTSQTNVYTVSAMVAKITSAGTFTLKVWSPEVEEKTAVIEQGKTTDNYPTISVNKYSPISDENFIMVELTANGTEAYATDIMAEVGEYIQPWQQASGEILNSQVTIDEAGIKISNNRYGNDYTKITPTEFSGYSDASGSQKKVFGVSRDITFAEKFNAGSEIDMSPIKIVPIKSGNKSGWAFVKTTEN